MTEKKPERVMAVINRLGSAVTQTPSGKYHCKVTLSFEMDSSEYVNLVLERLTNMRVPIDRDLYDDVVDLLEEQLAKAKTEQEELVRKHRIEVEQHLRTEALQTTEINRLKQIEAMLRFATNRPT